MSAPDPKDIPLQSPMPHSKELDNEEPRQNTGEPDIPAPSNTEHRLGEPGEFNDR